MQFNSSYFIITTCERVCKSLRGEVYFKMNRQDFFIKKKNKKNKHNFKWKFSLSNINFVINEIPVVCIIFTSDISVTSYTAFLFLICP